MAVIYNPETEKFIRDPATIIDSSAGGDTVKQGFEDRTEPALEGIVSAFNLLKTDGMIGVGVPATETARGIARVATSDEVKNGVTGINGPAFVSPEQYKANNIAKDITFDPVPSGLTATDTQGAIEEAYRTALKGSRWYPTAYMSWVRSGLTTITHNLNMSVEEQERFEVRCDAKFIAAHAGWSIGDIIRGSTPASDGFSMNLELRDIGPNRFVVRWPQSGFLAVNKDTGATATYLLPGVVQISLKVGY